MVKSFKIITKNDSYSRPVFLGVNKKGEWSWSYNTSDAIWYKYDFLADAVIRSDSLLSSLNCYLYEIVK